jgi:hypothetical protein
MNSNPLPVRSPLDLLMADFPGYRFWMRTIGEKLFYLAEATHPRIQPRFAQAETLGRLRAKLQAVPLREFTTNEPSIARVWDVLLGGKDNFAIDRLQADSLLDVFPRAAALARESRQFQARAVGYVARCNVRQFIDIGCGLPTAPNTHETAQSAQPGALVAYVDNDEQVLSHARSILARTPGVLAIEGDIGYPAEILCDWRIRERLSFREPVCIVLTMTLHFFGAQKAHQILRQLSDGIPYGSYIIVSAGSLEGDAGERFTREYCAGHLHHHTREDVARFMSGLQLVEPGIAEACRWRAPAFIPDGPRQGHIWAAVGRKVTA